MHPFEYMFFWEYASIYITYILVTNVLVDNFSCGRYRALNLPWLHLFGSIVSQIQIAKDDDLTKSESLV
jgi:hypothetical protein